MIKNREEALAAHELARSRMADRRKSTFIPFRKGEKVWLDSRNMKTRHNKKMKPKREGPFLITEVLGPVTYRLQLLRKDTSTTSERFFKLFQKHSYDLTENPIPFHQ